MSGTNSQIYEFGNFRLDKKESRLLRDGEPVALTPRTFDVLVALVERHGQLVTKDELMQSVWADSFVEDANLNVHISTLRKALGDNAFIETVPKKGYRFTGIVAEPTVVERFTRTSIVSEEEYHSQTNKHGRPLLLVAAVGALLIAIAGFAVFSVSRQRARGAAPEIKTLAVLPFKSLDREADGHLGIGIADTIITKVSQVERLVVRPTSAVQKYAASETDSIEAARQLGVDAVLEGAVQRAGERLRVTANLRRTSDGASLWAESFDMSSADIFAIEDEVSRKILANLRFKLDPTEVAKVNKQFTTNAEAYESYVKGMEKWQERRTGSSVGAIQEAIELFKQAIALDPSYGLAHAQLANCYAQLAVYRETDNPVWLGQAKQEIRTAETLDPNLAETHLARYELYYSVYENFDIDQARRELRLAQEINPSVGHSEAAHLFAHLGLEDLAMREAQRAMEIDPTDKATQDILITCYELLDKSSEAIAASERYFPDYVAAPGSRPIHSYYAERRFDELEKILEAKIAKISRSSTPGLAYSERALLWMMQGKTKEAMAQIPFIAEQMKPGRGLHHVAYNIAAIYALDGKTHESVAWLQKAADTGLPNYPMFVRDKNFDRVRNDAEFMRFMAELKTRWENFAREV